MTGRNPAARGRADGTQPAMVEWLESQDHVVQDLHRVGGGCPDLLVGTTWGELVLVECKSHRGKLTPEQRVWHMRWHHLPRCMPKSVLELRAWMERRKDQFEDLLSRVEVGDTAPFVSPSSRRSAPSRPRCSG